MKLFAFLKAQLASGEPQKYPARVTDVRNFGFFVDVPGLAMSGLVPLSTIEEDFYVFDEARRNLVGRPTRRMIQRGDRLTVQVAKVDTFKKQVNFCLAVEPHKPAAQHPPASRPSVTRPQQFRPDAKRPSASRSESSRRQDSRPSKSPTPAARPQLNRENKFVLRISVRSFGGKSRGGKR